ncbi:XRE family transcriptional regulator [Hymenobacter crusticola]|uniref:HTH cro/C1-type domain-containing protein n=1 Tax=Hymenobacter crusticola TaxID=1770526 RepID=A0A243W532_9BACT|nr:XRE family transcriptional regulator [Hymenobacter crusticola]OUJ67845.1 hypothetical protein BXP70_28480 [Hymenobacter crusticola]
MRLKELREKAGLTQEELGKRIGKSKTAISNIESGKNGPRMSTLASIAKVLDVEVQDILTDTGRSQPLTASDTPNTVPISFETSLVGSAPLPLITYTTFSFFTQSCLEANQKDLPVVHITEMPDHDYQDAAVFEVKGNSMAPRYPERSRFVIRPVAKDNWSHTQGVHVIVLSSHLLLMKRIVSNLKGVLRLRSDANGEETEVVLTEVSCLWKVGEGIYYPAED